MPRPGAERKIETSERWPTPHCKQTETGPNLQGSIDINASHSHAEFQRLAPAGYYLALRIGFAFPAEETNALPRGWVRHYTERGLLLNDPVLRWAYANTGVIRWSDLQASDPHGLIDQAAQFGLHHGVSVCCVDAQRGGQRSYGSFLRADRAFTDVEIRLLHRLFEALHAARLPPSNLTSAELEALGLVRDGMLLKEIAYDLGVSEGAIKQRLKNAKKKLGARTSAQAVTMASDFGLL